MLTKYDVKLMILLPLMCFFMSDQNLFAQNHIISGIVLDSASREPLPFVNIMINEGPSGGISDIDGKFSIKTDEQPKYLKMSYVGYHPLQLEIVNEKDIIVEMAKTAYQLGEVIILPGENPAHRIIDSAVVHREFNNPMLLESFIYMSYNRFHIAPDLNAMDDFYAAQSDSTADAYRAFFDNHYLFLMESVSQRKFKSPDLSEEKVLASRVAGFSDPLFTLLMTQIQSFAFYNDLITISDKNYVNPISKGSTEKYFFLIEDTLYDGADSIFVISYRPGRNKNFDAMQGLLYIHTDGWAIQNVTAAPARDEKGFGIRIQQQYERVGENGMWFPRQLNTEILFNNLSLNQLELYGQGRTYISEVQINPDIKRRNFSEAQVIFEEASTSTDKLFLKYGSPYVGSKDSATYFFLDSLGKENNFDRMLGLMKALISGNIPVKWVDIQMMSLIGFNDFEGWRLGLGLETNSKLLTKLSVGGYGAYGFIDKQWKYGGSLAYKSKSTRELTVKGTYAYDIFESGEKRFFDFKMSLIDQSAYRYYLIDVMDYKEEMKLSVSGQLFRYTYGHVSFSDAFVHAGDDYVYGQTWENIYSGTSDFSVQSISLGVRYEPNIKIIRGLDYQLGLIGQSSKPAFKIEYQAALDWFGGLEFHSVDLWLMKRFYTKYFGKSEFVFQLGFIDRDVPYAFMRVIPASFRKFGVYVPNSFLTARMNEFISDRYVYAFWRHDFGKLLLRTKYISPGFTIAVNSAFGSFQSSDKHKNRTMKGLEKGFFEGGLVIDNILQINAYSLGVAGFYRFGAYMLPEFNDNLSLSISFKAAL